MVQTSSDYLAFRPSTRNYIKVEKNLTELDRIEITLANENGEILNISEEDKCGETYLTVHVIDEKYLRS